MAAHTLLGYLLAVGMAGAAHGVELQAAALGLLLWVVCLNGGTLALNSAFDRDEGDVAYLKRPPPPPRHLAAFSLCLIGAGQLMALALPARFAAVYAVCFVLSILYSVPPFRLKAVAGADWVINMWGFGTLTPYAGWATTGLPLDLPRAVVLLGFCPLFAALYPLTQLYQLEEDSRRGDRTFALVLGTRRSLDIAIGGVLLAFGLFLTAAEKTRWNLVLLGGALVTWLVVVIPWRRSWSGMTPKRHQRGMYLALGAWAVTDLAVLLIWG